MRVRCLYNTGEALRAYEYNVLSEKMMGRFGATAETYYGMLDIGEEYEVMGILILDTYQAYLIDDGTLVAIFPCQLFEIMDDRVNTNWHFRLIDKDETTYYPLVQAIFGYPELCLDKKAIEKLIDELDEESYQIYFKRKRELKKEY